MDMSTDAYFTPIEDIPPLSEATGPGLVKLPDGGFALLMVGVTAPALRTEPMDRPDLPARIGAAET